MSEAVSTEKELVTEKAPESKSSDKKSDKAPKKSKFAGVKAEFAKIIWPEKISVVKNTTAVVLVSIFVAIAVKVSDLLIQAVLNLLV
jgi:preprotein translocase subunit SecE